MTHDHKQDSCCGGDKHHGHEKNKPETEKEKDGCCGGQKDKKPETEKAKTQDGGCCGGGHK
tara:strand:- start:366 stop:548 length:183 start_codon:yes stop_codon:yes gene_type:complete